VLGALEIASTGEFINIAVVVIAKHRPRAVGGRPRDLQFAPRGTTFGMDFRCRWDIAVRQSSPRKLKAMKGRKRATALANYAGSLRLSRQV